MKGWRDLPIGTVVWHRSDLRHYTDRRLSEREQWFSKWEKYRLVKQTRISHIFAPDRFAPAEVERYDHLLVKVAKRPEPWRARSWVLTENALDLRYWVEKHMYRVKDHFERHATPEQVVEIARLVGYHPLPEEESKE